MDMYVPDTLHLTPKLSVTRKGLSAGVIGAACDYYANHLTDLKLTYIPAYIVLTTIITGTVVDGAVSGGTVIDLDELRKIVVEKLSIQLEGISAAINGGTPTNAMQEIVRITVENIVKDKAPFINVWDLIILLNGHVNVMILALTVELKKEE